MISKINEILLELKTRESKVMKEKKAVITLYHCTKVVLWSLIACHAPLVKSVKSGNRLFHLLFRWSPFCGLSLMRREGRK